MKITPLRTMVLVELEAPNDDATGFVDVVRLANQPSMYARVRAIGPEVREVEVGARYIVSRLQGIELDGGVLIPESAVLSRADSLHEADNDAAAEDATWD